MRYRSAAVVATLLVLASVAPVGAAPAASQSEDCSFPHTATDASGTEVTLEQRPERVTTLNPSAAQTMWEFDAQGQVVGTTKYAAYLQGADEKTNVSKEGGFGASVEKVVGTEPDLVLAPNTTSRQTVQSLREAGLTVYVFSMSTSVDDVANKTETIGRLTGNCEAAARTNAWMHANVEAVRNATTDVDRPGVMYPLGGGYVAGGGTFISAMIETSGGTNVVAEADISDYPRVSDEKVLELAPEVIITTDANRYLLGQEPYASTPAGENNETVDLDQNYLDQPAPRSVVYTTRNLSTGLHPDVEVQAVAKSEITLETPTPSPTATDEPTEVGTDGATAGNGPGFGLVAALVALAAAALVGRLR